MYHWIDGCTTWCPDTPENWANFRRKKAALLNKGLDRPKKKVKYIPRKPVIFYGFNTVKS